MGTNTKKTYWKGLEQLRNDEAFVKHADKEFVNIGVEDNGHSRRDFLKMMGFSVAAASLAACEAPVRHAIPFVNKPVDVDPGIPNYYASTYVNGGDYCSIVVKTRDGRPIKIEGNSLSPVSRGGTNAQVEASVLSLYDNYRLRGPQAAGKSSDWATVDGGITAKLGEIAAQGGQIRIISNTIISPSTKAAIERFKSKYPTAQHIQYDPISYNGMMLANEESFGSAFIPSYDFSKAKVIVSFGADFLGTWLSPIEFASQYAVNRKIDEDHREMSRHYQFESILSLTGANADYRTAIRPSQTGLVVAQLYNLLAAKAGVAALSTGIDKIANLEKAAEDLWANKGASLVVARSNNKAVQTVINAINDLLGNYGSSILPNMPMNIRQGNDMAMMNFVEEAAAGKVGAAIFYNCNPVYDHPAGEKLAGALKGMSLSVSTSLTADETASGCSFSAPDHHFLESWNDFEPRRGSYSLSQPTITPIFHSRAAQESFMVWAGDSKADYFSFIKENWKNWFYGKASNGADFQSWWDKCLYDGVLDMGAEPYKAVSFSGNLGEAVASIAKSYSANNTGFELVLFESYGVGNGSQANNPLLQELPDPISKVVWDHPVSMSQKDAKKLGITMDGESNTQKAKITVNGKSIEVPVLVQPGQAEGTLGLALGYGRTKVGKVAENLGVNAYPFITMGNAALTASVQTGVTVAKTTAAFQLAQTQTHQTYMGRESVIQESTLPAFKENPAAGREIPKVTKWDEKVDPSTLSLWKGHDYKDHHWGMMIDLNSCIGCGACIVACNVENNVALVGKDEVIRRREMHWMRIDRYYSSEGEHGSYESLEVAAENPEVVFQPMLCQHCNNAPCETVCPVAATTHSSEGINQMTYNRCIGTRYCANNCPYKVRRFNWFKYHDNDQFASVNPAMNTDLGRMVLNPEVTVRSRGVMEKCSFCVQRVQSAKVAAKREKRTLRDGEVVTACQASCATGAILFGDLNNEESQIVKKLKITKDEKRPYGIDKKVGNPRAYRVLEEIGVKPNIFYLTKIRNKDEQKKEA